MSRTKDQKKSKKDSSRTNHRPAMSNTILGDFGPESDSEGSSLNLSATLNAQHSQGVSTMRSLGGQIAPVSQKAPQISQPAPPNRS